MKISIFTAKLYFCAVILKFSYQNIQSVLSTQYSIIFLRQHKSNKFIEGLQKYFASHLLAISTIQPILTLNSSNWARLFHLYVYSMWLCIFYIKLGCSEHCNFRSTRQACRPAWLLWINYEISKVYVVFWHLRRLGISA